MNREPVLELLLKFCIPNPDLSETARLLKDPRLDWDSFYGWAQRHGMAGIVAPRFQEYTDVPETQQRRWNDAWRESAMKDLSQLAALDRILSAAEKERLNPLLVKGLSVHFQAYPVARTARGSGDIDLLIRPHEAPAMDRALGQAGFSFLGRDSWSRPVSDWATLLGRDSEALFYHSGLCAHLDLHWGLCAPRLERAAGLTLYSRLWESPRVLAMGSVCASIPGREEEILCLCVHLAKGGRFLLRNLADLAHLVHAGPPVNWTRLLRIARETGSESCAFYPLEWLAELSPRAVPEETLSRLSERAGARWLLRPSLRLRRLFKTQSCALTDLSTYWNAVLFARRPGRWVAYQATRIADWLSRRFFAMLRWILKTRAISSAGQSA